MPIRVGDASVVSRGFYMKQDYTFGEVFNAAYQTSFASGGILSAIGRAGRKVAFDDDPSFNPNDHITEQDHNEFPGLTTFLLDAGSQEEQDQIRFDIREERRLKGIVQNAQGAKATAAMFAAGLADPINLIPVSKVFSIGAAARAGNAGRILSGALEGAAVAGVTEAATQAILHATQYERTLDESVKAVGFASLFGGVLGGAAAALPAAKKKALMGALEKDYADGTFAEKMAAVAPSPAEAARMTDDELNSFMFREFTKLYPEMSKQFGEKSISWRAVNKTVLGPAGQFYRSESNAARTFGAQMFDTPVLRQFDTVGGVPRPSTAVERAIDYDKAIGVARYTEDVRNVFHEFRADKEMRAVYGKMKFRQFDEMVGEAMVSGDVLDVPGSAYINKAAQRSRKILDEIKDEALRVGAMTPDQLDLRGTATSYRPRTWLKEKIRNNPRAFKDEIIFPMFESNNVPKQFWEAEAENIIDTMTHANSIGKDWNGTVRIPGTTMTRKLIIDDRLIGNWVDNRASTAIKRVVDEMIPEIHIKKALMRPTPEIDSLVSKAENISKVSEKFASKAELLDEIENNRALKELVSDAHREDLSRAMNEIGSVKEQIDLIARQKTKAAEELTAARFLGKQGQRPVKKGAGSAAAELKKVRRQLKNLFDQIGDVTPGDIEMAKAGYTLQDELDTILQYGDLKETERALVAAATFEEEGIASAFKAEKAAAQADKAARAGESVADVATYEARLNSLKESEAALVKRLSSLRDTTANIRTQARDVADDITARIRFSRQALREAQAADDLQDTLLSRAYQLRRSDHRRVINGSYVKAQINQEYRDLMRYKPDGSRELKSLIKQRDKMLENVDLTMQRMHGLAGLPSASDRDWFRMTKTAKAAAAIGKSGQFLFSSMAEVGYNVMVNGVSSIRVLPAVASAPRKLLTSHGPQTVARMDMIAELAGIDRSIQAFESTFDPNVSGSVLEKVVGTAKEIEYTSSMLGPWNALMKNIGGYSAQDSLIRDSVDFAAGKLGKAGMKRLALARLSEADAKKIAKLVTSGAIDHETKSFGKVLGDLYLPKTDTWADRGLARRFEESTLSNMRRGAAFVPGQGDLPKAFSHQWASIPLMFKSFAAASHNRILIPAIQNLGPRVVAGAMVAIGIGALRYGIKQALAGEEVGDAATIAAEAVDGSGVLAILAEAANIYDTTISATGRDDLTFRDAIGAAPPARYRNINFAGALLGPVGGTGQTIFFDIPRSFLKQDAFTMTDLDRIRRSIVPGSKAFYIKDFVDEGVVALGKAMDLPDPYGFEARADSSGLIQK